MRLVLKNAEVFSGGYFSSLDVLIFDGIVAAVSPDIMPCSGDFVFDFSGCHILPGLADVHVHLREPGFSYKETISTGTAAAAHGGFTAVCAMPNLSPVPDTPENLLTECELIKRDACIRVFPYATITKGRQGEGKICDFSALKGLAVAFSDDGTGVQTAELMKAAMLSAAENDVIIAAHCEDNSLLYGGYIHEGKYAAAHGHKGICSESEWKQLERDLRLAAETGCRYHVCHISTKESVDLIRRAKAEGVRVSCETAPHYLALCEDDLQEKGNFKMNPPLRSYQDKEALLAGIADGTIDVIATDHAPHSAEEKSLGLEKSTMGVVGLETSFSVCFSTLVESQIITLQKLISLMSEAPRRLFSLGGGKIEAGLPADLCVFDLKRRKKVEPDEFFSMGKSTPFSGMSFSGECLLTMCGGKIVYSKEGF